MTALVTWLFYGLFIGALARLIVPGRQPIGCAWTLLSGIVGALAGGAIVSAVFDTDTDGFDLPSFAGAVLVATFLVAVAAALVARGEERGTRRRE